MKDRKKTKAPTRALQTRPAMVARDSRRPIRRPGLPKVSEEMKAWAVALSAEIRTWPSVTTRPMFGLTALYRKGKIFAVLPRTRGMEAPNALALKLGPAGPRVVARAQRDPRIGFTDALRTHWLTFKLNSDADLHEALVWLSRAYEAAR